MTHDTQKSKRLTSELLRVLQSMFDNSYSHSKSSRR